MNESLAEYPYWGLFNWIIAGLGSNSRADPQKVVGLKSFFNEEKGFKLCVEIFHKACMDSVGKC